MSILKTSIIHTYLVGFQSNENFHRGYMIISYCKNENEALQKAKEELKKNYLKAENYKYAIV